MTDAPTVDPVRVLAARRAVFLVFAVNGMAFATWASRIPDAKAALGLTPGELGTTLVAGSAGSVLGLLASGWISHRLGPRASVVLGVLGVTLGLVVMGAGVTLAHSRLLLGLGLVPLGLCVGIWDVGMNLEGARVEQLLQVAVMHPLKEALDAFIASTQKAVSGEYVVELYKGNIDIVSRSSQSGLFFPDVRSIKSASFNQKECAPAAHIRGLPYELIARRNQLAGLSSEIH